MNVLCLIEALTAFTLALQAEGGGEQDARERMRTGTSHKTRSTQVNDLIFEISVFFITVVVLKGEKGEAAPFNF